MNTNQQIKASSTAEEFLTLHDISLSDLAMVRKFGQILIPKLEDYNTHFYGWAENLPEFKHFFSDASRLERVKSLQSRYWRSFFEAEVNEHYISERIKIGETHARVGLSLATYFAGMNMSMVIFTKRLYDGSLYNDEYSTLITALTKLLNMDTTIVVETYSALMNRRASEQSEALLQMSTPVTMIWQDVLMLPIVGIIDSKRAQDIMAAVLEKIEGARAKIFIMDISGVAVVDTAVANHFIKITKATRLMGCECLVSGVSPSIAQTMVQLGINVGEVKTNATLRDALEEAFKIINLSVISSKNS